ncbi:hypothetical protein HAHE_33260 [Haloferula helveola]|uniref:Roadblock/LAMTOR2 domain-containing protein n=1 Tax=Haloferula helveola TaxID=490095 RepID=A0ABM7RGR4_9BACT|nr:hypothetical protein HAHE_33260 [Haloferula helveola]
MDPVEPWIDADAVRRLARQLVVPPRSGPSRGSEDPGFGPGFEGFIPGGQPALKSVPEPSPEEAPEPKPFLSTEPVAREAPPALPEEAPEDAVRGPLVARMEGFRDWMVRNLDARGAFILDREGEPVLDDPAYAKLHFLARSLAQAYRPVKGEVGNVHVKVGAEAYLTVVPVDTAFGRLVLGTVLSKPLDAESAAVVAEALSRASRPERR